MKGRRDEGLEEGNEQSEIYFLKMCIKTSYPIENLQEWSSEKDVHDWSIVRLTWSFGELRYALWEGIPVAGEIAKCYCKRVSITRAPLTDKASRAKYIPFSLASYSKIVNSEQIALLIRKKWQEIPYIFGSTTIQLPSVTERFHGKVPDKRILSKWICP